MKWINIVICVILFLVGMWIGTCNQKITVVREIEKVDYLDTTADDFYDRLEAVANTMQRTVRPIEEKKVIADLHRQNKQEIEGLHCQNKQKIEDIYQSNKYKIKDMEREIENLRHEIWQEGYIKGYEEGTQSKNMIGIKPVESSPCH